MISHSATAEPGSRPEDRAAAGTAIPRIALVGVHGFGERHLANLARLEEAGALELVAVADPNPPAPGRLNDTVAVFPDLNSLLAAQTTAEVRADIVILATPLQTHLHLGDPAKNASLAYALCYVLSFGLLMYLLYKFRIFLKV